MPSVSVETEDEFSWKVVAVAATFPIAFILGCVIWWLEGCWADLIGFYAAHILLIAGWDQVRQSRLRSTLPPDAVRAAELVGRWFAGRHPRVPVNEWIVRAVEPGRFVIAVSYCEGHPRPPRRYFAITRPNLTDVSELPKSDWEKPWWIEEADQTKTQND